MGSGMPGYYIAKQGYPGGGAFRGALNYYAGQEFGPAGRGPGQLAGAQATDTAAGNYYSTPTGTDPSGGMAAANAQGAFGNLLGGEAAANNAAAATNAQTKSQAGQGILAATQGYAGDISANIQAQMALNEASGRAGLQQAGMLSGLIGSFTDPHGQGSNIINAFTGGNTSGLAQGVTGGKGLLSSLFGGGAGSDPTALLSSGIDPSSLGDIAGITGTGAGAGAGDFFSTLLASAPDLALAA